MDEDFSSKKPASLPFECDSCGQNFKTWDLLRQHQIDCQTDDFETPV
jgi:hypothetical protein